MITSLPDDLQKLLPQALDVIRCLGRLEGGAAHLTDIMGHTGLSERVARKAIRRLITRGYTTMPDVDYYQLTANGHDAAATLRAYDGEEFDQIALAPEPNADGVLVETLAEIAASAKPPIEEPAAQQAAQHIRRLSVFLPKELVERSTAQLRFGFEPPTGASAPLIKPARIILRLNAPNCDIEPVERPLEVPPGAAAGPAIFRITPRQTGTVRIRVQAFQLVTLETIVPVGGMFFDLDVAGFPTPDSAEFKALATPVRLHPGQDD